MQRRQKPPSLWADPPPEEEGDAFPDVRVRWLEPDAEEEPAASPPAGDPEEDRPRRQLAPALALAAVVVALLVLALVNPGGSLTAGVVPSGWGDVKMRCDTVRSEGGGGAWEGFTCRASDGGRLPPGIYVTPDSQWISDITRRRAAYNEIVISRDGELRGWAIYRER